MFSNVLIINLDVNECATLNGGCEEECDDYVGGYQCSCTSPGTVLSKNNHTCSGGMAN